MHAVTGCLGRSLGRRLPWLAHNTTQTQHTPKGQPRTTPRRTAPQRQRVLRIRSFINLGASDRGANASDRRRRDPEHEECPSTKKGRGGGTAETWWVCLDLLGVVYGYFWEYLIFFEGVKNLRPVKAPLISDWVQHEASENIPHPSFCLAFLPHLSHSIQSKRPKYQKKPPGH